MLPNSLKELINCFKFLPGVGSKTAERMAYSMIDFDEKKLTSFSDAIIGIRDNIHNCGICGNLTDGNICGICSNDDRDKSVILVVEKPKDIVLFEKLGIYHGVYHVLNGLISPLDGVGPDDINLSLLLDRINNGSVIEVIMALKPSIEGETTMQYIKRILNNSSVKVSKIATGVPIGTEMEYIDSLTLEMAIDERKNIS